MSTFTTDMDWEIGDDEGIDISTDFDAPANAKVRRDRDQHILRGDVEVRNLVLNAVRKGIPNLQIADSMLSGEISRTIAGASQVTITVHDFGRKISKSRIFRTKTGRLRAIDIHLDGLWFRLTKMQKQGDDVNLIFEDRQVVYLRDKKGPTKAATRGKVTRAEYILRLIRSVKQERIKVRIHELHKEQPIAKLSKEDRKKLKNEGDPGGDDRKGNGGFPLGTHVAGVTSKQLRTISVSMRIAEQVNAGERATMAMLVAGFGESNWSTSAREHVYGTHVGVFQSNQIPANDLKAQTWHFLKGGRSFLSGGAIGYVRAHPTATLGMVAQAVEISDGSATYYDSFTKKARKVYDAWGGVSGGGAGGTTYRKKKYQYRVKKKESYWGAIQRMAEEVNWRAFVTGGVFHYISEEDMFKSRPRWILSEEKAGVINIDYDWDRRKKMATAEATVRISRWAIPPGVTVRIEDLGVANERWLVETTTRQLFSAEGVVSLKQPIKELPEPAPEIKSESTIDGGDYQGTQGERALAAARDIHKRRYPYVWGGGHRTAGRPDRGTGRDPGIGYDCSGGTAACCKAAGGIWPQAWMTNVPASGTMASSFGEPGVGKTLTLWASSGHVFLEAKVDGRIYHLGTGRYGKPWSGFGVNGSIHPHSGFTPRHSPRDTGVRRGGKQPHGTKGDDGHPYGGTSGGPYGVHS